MRPQLLHNRYMRAPLRLPKEVPYYRPGTRRSIDLQRCLHLDWGVGEQNLPWEGKWLADVETPLDWLLAWEEIKRRGGCERTGQSQCQPCSTTPPS
jgi:hypothetical protein